MEIGGRKEGGREEIDEVYKILIQDIESRVWVKSGRTGELREEEERRGEGIDVVWEERKGFDDEAG